MGGSETGWGLGPFAAVFAPGPTSPVTKYKETTGTKINCIHKHAQLLQSRLTVCDSVDCSPPGPSVHEILQARILEWVAMPSSRGSSWHRDQTRVSCISCIGRQILLPLCNLGSPKTMEIFLETGDGEAPFSQSSGFQPRLYWFGRKVSFPQVFPSITCYKPLGQPDTTFCWTLWKLAGVFLFFSLKYSWITALYHFQVCSKVIPLYIHFQIIFHDRLLY